MNHCNCTITSTGQSKDWDKRIMLALFPPKKESHEESAEKWMENMRALAANKQGDDLMPPDEDDEEPEVGWMTQHK